MSVTEGRVGDEQAVRLALAPKREPLCRALLNVEAALVVPLNHLDA